jgi:hypothetical protein
MHLNLQQELELVAYIEDLTKQGLLPTRTMIRNFGSVVAQKQIVAEKRAQRQRDTEMKKKEREAKAAERVAAKERKQQERATATAQNSRDTLEKRQANSLTQRCKTSDEASS